MLFGFKVNSAISVRTSKLSFIDIALPTSFSLFSSNSFISGSPSASSVHPCYFGKGSPKSEITEARCYVIYGDSSGALDLAKVPSRIRVERFASVAISANE